MVRKVAGISWAVVVLGGLAAGVFGSFWFYRASARPSPPAGDESDSPPRRSPRPVLLRAREVASRDRDYVGSQACASCHKELCEQYLASPMGQSFSGALEAAVVEDYGSSKFAPPGRQHYEVSRDDAGLTHTEITVDGNGQPLLRRAENIDYVVGSGKRGRAYVFAQNGLLYQSPIGWYSQSGKWDLSPGYAPAHHPRFSRRIGDGCLYCHAGRMHNLTGADDRYEEPIVAEAVIGCERCHGPGKQHIEWQTQKEAGTALPSTSDPIVNPSRLEPERRESVCYQCHLLGRSVIPRCGRGFFDFRPGDLLEDVFVVLSRATDAPTNGSMQAVSQVEQMRASKCYLASQGALGCTSCHDPHSSPSAERRAEHYRRRCLTCHETQGCTADVDARTRPPANDSCIHCHMPTLATRDVPHTSLTDHRVLRDPGKSDASGTKAAKAASDWTVFDRAELRLPPAEVERATGIALMSDAWNRGDKQLAAKAQDHLLRVLNVSVHEVRDQLAEVDDGPLLEELGASFMLGHDVDTADACWKRLLEIEPQNETALMGLAKTADERADVEGYEAWVDRLAQIAPNSEAILTMQVQIRTFHQDLRGAAELAERVLTLNPGQTYQRGWLVDVYRRLGESDKALHHQKLLEQITPPRSGPSKP